MATRMNAELHEQTVTVLTDFAEEARVKLTESTLPPKPVIELAIRGIVAKRGNRVMRKTAKPFDADPLGNLLHRSIAFHRSTGHLAGLFGVGWDCDRLVSDRFEHDQKAALIEAYGGEVPRAKDVQDHLDTLAIVLLQGQSRAASAWERAIHG